jgi:hypothetical protein
MCVFSGVVTAIMFLRGFGSSKNKKIALLRGMLYHYCHRLIR